MQALQIQLQEQQQKMQQKQTAKENRRKRKEAATQGEVSAANMEKAAQQLQMVQTDPAMLQAIWQQAGTLLEEQRKQLDQAPPDPEQKDTKEAAAEQPRQPAEKPAPVQQPRKPQAKQQPKEKQGSRGRSATRSPKRPEQDQDAMHTG